MNPFLRRAGVLALLATIPTSAAHAQERDWSKVEIKTEHIAGSVYMITGAGGNENFARDGVVIVAQDNVRTRMAIEQVNELSKRVTPPSPAGALPVLTFSESVTLHLNGDTARVVHVPPAHTDGDAYVAFESANVVHTGDLFFNGGYPVIDVSAGGGISGMIAAADRLLQAVRPDAKLIPGHGPLGTPGELRAFRDMLATARERVARLLAAGKSADATVAAAPTADLDGRWGKAFVEPERFVRSVYASLAREKP